MDQSVLPKFPTTKIKTIMKSSQNVDQVGSVGVFAMTRSAVSSEFLLIDIICCTNLIKVQKKKSFGIYSL